MKKPVFIWRKSVYTNDFKCCKCKRKLANNGEIIEDAVLVAPDYPQKGASSIVCAYCKDVAAVVYEVETDLKGGLHGSLEDFMEGGEK